MPAKRASTSRKIAHTAAKTMSSKTTRKKSARASSVLRRLRSGRTCRTSRTTRLSSPSSRLAALCEAFRAGALTRWKTELIARIIPENRDIVRAAKEAKADFVTDLDSYNWNKINGIRSYLAKDSIDEKSLFTLLINALNEGDYATASGLQVEMYDKVEELKSLYDSYVKNMI